MAFALIALPVYNSARKLKRFIKMNYLRDIAGSSLEAKVFYKF